MRTLDITADELVATLVDRRGVAILDSCGVGHLGSRLLIAGVDPIEIVVLKGNGPIETLQTLQQFLGCGCAAIFTISYDFGAKAQNVKSRHNAANEPDIYIALFDSLIVHDFEKRRTFVCGKDEELGPFVIDSKPLNRQNVAVPEDEPISNFSRDDYLRSIETIQEYIVRGDTYQTNLTQKLTVRLGEKDSPGEVFLRLRNQHPAPFAAYIDRGESHVVSASPERFFKIAGRTITTSPIKGTRRRSSDEIEDARLRRELLSSEKDRAENTMIVDLLRNDLGRVCEYGSVTVKKLCGLEEHPSLFHLVSTIEGTLRTEASFSDVIAALFPCGSITGTPKIRTMQIIDQLEPSPRGLSMGAIGYYVPEDGFDGLLPGTDVSVAIRTMVIRDGLASFNVGGGITIDSDPGEEYEESLLKAKALLAALRNK